jgi:hypothetical protein
MNPSATLDLEHAQVFPHQMILHYKKQYLQIPQQDSSYFLGNT